MHNLKVALLIPAYNAAPFIGNIIADARAQEPPFAEIIVYDDASTDSTVEVARSLGVSHVITGTANRGAAYARNRLIEATSCPWVHFHDADDRMDKDYLKVVVAASPRSDEILFCGLKVYDVRKQQYGNSYEFTHLNTEKDLGKFLRTNFPMGCGLYPTDALRAIGGFREILRGGEDFDLHIRLILAGTRFRALPDLLNTYCRYGETTFTETNLARLHSDVLSLYERYLDELPARYLPVLGELLMEQAYKLYANDQLSEMDKAIHLSHRAGQRSVSSSHAVVRHLSRVIGVRRIFWLRGLAKNFRRTG